MVLHPADALATQPGHTKGGKQNSAFRAIHYNKDIVQSSPHKQWRPYPWCLWPDWFSGFLGLLIMVPLAPPTLLLLTLSNIWMSGLKWLWNTLLCRVPIVRDIPDFVYEKWAKSTARRIMKDERNSEFIPSLLWLGLFVPALFGLAVYRL